MDDPEVQEWLAKEPDDLPEIAAARLRDACGAVDPGGTPFAGVPPPSAELLFRFTVERRLRGETTASVAEYEEATLEDARRELADVVAACAPWLGEGREGGVDKLAEDLQKQGISFSTRLFTKFDAATALWALARVRLARRAHARGTGGPMLLQDTDANEFWLLDGESSRGPMDADEAAAAFAAAVARRGGVLGRIRVVL